MVAFFQPRRAIERLNRDVLKNRAAAAAIFVPFNPPSVVIVEPLGQRAQRRAGSDRLGDATTLRATPRPGRRSPVCPRSP